MYSEAYKGYDLTNHFLSFFTDSSIRKKAAEIVLDGRPSKVLDMATGTGDLPLYISELASKQEIAVQVVGIDVNKEMLGIAKDKAKRRGQKIKFDIGDVTKLGYSNKVFDSVTCSFAFKNFNSPEKVIREAHRILNKRGRFVIVDIAKPTTAIGKYAFSIYRIYMALFGVLTGKRLYKWLPKSTSNFDKQALVEALKRNGFPHVEEISYSFGIAFILVCRM